MIATSTTTATTTTTTSAPEGNAAVDERIVELITVAAATASELAAMMEPGCGIGGEARVSELSERYAALCAEVHAALQAQAAAVDARALPPLAPGIAPPLPASAISRRALCVELRKVDAVCKSLAKLEELLSCPPSHK